MFMRKTDVKARCKVYITLHKKSPELLQSFKIQQNHIVIKINYARGLFIKISFTNLILIEYQKYLSLTF
jgi:hypothetical protein